MKIVLLENEYKSSINLVLLSNQDYFPTNLKFVGKNNAENVSMTYRRPLSWEARLRHIMIPSFSNTEKFENWFWNWKVWNSWRKDIFCILFLILYKSEVHNRSI